MIKIFRYTPSAILVADLHIRDTTPTCRTDNFPMALSDKLSFLFNYAWKLGVPLLIAGDVGESPEWRNWLITELTLLLNRYYSVKVIAVAGQHDLPNHSLKLWRDSGTATLHFSNDRFTMLNNNTTTIPNGIRVYGCPYGIEPEHREAEILLMHRMVVKEKKLWGKQIAYSAKYFLNKYDSHNLIVSGDNHQPFVEKHKGRILVNPGSMMRINATQKKHRPRFYVWFEENNSVEPVYFPIKKGVVSDHHIVKAKEKEERIKKYVHHKPEVSISFKENIKNNIRVNKPKKKVREKVWGAVK